MQKDKNARLMSLDALRGFDMLWIMGLSRLVIAACAYFGAKGCWLATQMSHPSWQGFTHHDTIFPLFIFLAGATWPFSRASAEARGVKTNRLVLKVLKRTLLLMFIGIAMYDLFKFNVAATRFDSVLGHIGICWGVAALFYLWIRDWRVYLAVAIGLLVAHWAILYFVTAPDLSALLASTDPAIRKIVASHSSPAWGSGNFSYLGNFAGWLDRTFKPGYLALGIVEADGILAKISGSAIAMFGVLAGCLLRREGVSGNRTALTLAGAGVISLVAMAVWMPWCPLNKILWTPSFACATVGYSFLMLAIFYWIIDVRGFRRWTFFFVVIGMNSITIYVLMRLCNFDHTAGIFFGGLSRLVDDADYAKIVLSFGRLAVEWLLLWFLYSRKIFFKV